MLLRRVLRRHLVRVSIETEVLRRVLRRGCVIEGAYKVLRRQKHALLQSTTPFACTLFKGFCGLYQARRVARRCHAEANENISCEFQQIPVNSVHTRCIVKTSGFTRGVCKNRGSD